MMTEADREHSRFFSKVEKTASCWLWIAGKNEAGYGLFRFRGKCWLAHRVSWTLLVGETTQKVLHTCDTPACVNPSHLFLGTQGDNVQDAMAKGRFLSIETLIAGRPELIARGERRWNAKLTVSQIQEIRSLAGSASQKQIAVKFAVHPAVISRIINRTRWTHVS